MNFIVDRKTWDRATQEHISNGYLLDDVGNKCCLGFVCKQLGFTDKNIKFCTFPSHAISIDREVLEKVKPEIKDFYVAQDINPNNDIESPGLSFSASQINDSTQTNDAEKEEKLQALFVEYNHTIEFIN